MPSTAAGLAGQRFAPPRDRAPARMPTSECGPACLARTHAGPSDAGLVASPQRQVMRTLALIGVLVAAIGVVASLPLLTGTGRAALTRRWCRAVLRAVGVRLMHEPAAPTDTPDGPALVTANHVSWLDIPALLAVQPMPVVAKTDVRHWPVVGFLAARAGTVFIDRARLRRLPATVAEVAAHLRGGRSVLAFPEGTTRCGATVGPFFPAMFQAAVDAGVPVRPVAVSYRLASGQPAPTAAFIGDDTLLASVRRVVATRGLTVQVRRGPLLHPSPGTPEPAHPHHHHRHVSGGASHRMPHRRLLATRARSHVADG